MRLQSGRMAGNLGFRVLQRDPKAPSFLLGACSLLEWPSRSRARRSSSRSSSLSISKSKKKRSRVAVYICRHPPTPVYFCKLSRAGPWRQLVVIESDLCSRRSQSGVKFRQISLRGERRKFRVRLVISPRDFSGRCSTAVFESILVEWY